jgi:hypothetical protein
MTKKLNELQIAEEIKKILASHKRPYEKKLALFNLIKNLEVGDLPSEKERVNYLLESCLLNELAKQSMKEYKKTTAEIFSKTG